MTISLCMIVRNEASVLGRALANWRQLADELIICDTGSTDDTVRTAQAAGALVVHYEMEPPGNLGEARNYGLQYASGEWVVVLDGDEIIRNPTELRSFILSQPANVGAINVVFENFTLDGVCDSRFLNRRIFRRAHYLYRYRAHEYPCQVSQETVHVIDSSFVFEHRTPEGRDEYKKQYYLSMLQLDVKENPGNPRPIFYLHCQLLITQQYQAAVNVGSLYMEQQTPFYRYHDMLGNMAIAYIELNEPEKALHYLHQALAEQPQRRLWWWMVADLYMQLGNHEVALQYLRGGAAIRLPNEEYFWLIHADVSQKINTAISECEKAINALPPGAYLVYSHSGKITI